MYFMVIGNKKMGTLRCARLSSDDNWPQPHHDSALYEGNMDGWMSSG